jgi:hypothetical protein
MDAMNRPLPFGYLSFATAAAAQSAGLFAAADAARGIVRNAAAAEVPVTFVFAAALHTACNSTDFVFGGHENKLFKLRRGIAWPPLSSHASTHSPQFMEAGSSTLVCSSMSIGRRAGDSIRLTT